jgi:CRISPR-associated protein Cas2
MGAEKHWHLVCYDIRDHHRWARIYKLLKGTGEHPQLSIFRVHLSVKQLEKLRLDLENFMEDEDDLLIVRLCDSCAKRVIDSREFIWKEPMPGFEVF